MGAPRGASGVTRLWLLACAASAVMAAALVGILSQRRSAPPPVVQEPAGAAEAVPCEALPALDFSASAEGEGPPVILWAAAPTRLFLDGVATFSAPEAPRRFPPGEHRVRIEAEGYEPLETKVRFERNVPALLHAQLLPRGGGVTLLRWGAACVSCPRALGEESLAHEPSPASNNPGLLLSQAALAIRSGRRPQAAQALRHVPPKARQGVLWGRLAAQVLHDTFQVDEGRALLRDLPSAAAAELPGLLVRLDELQTAESLRSADVTVARWNRLTERFHVFLTRFGPSHPGPTDVVSRRLGALSVAFEDATQQGSGTRQAEALAAAEGAFAELVRQLQSLAPDDCAFHREVYAAASAEGS